MMNSGQSKRGRFRAVGLAVTLALVSTGWLRADYAGPVPRPTDAWGAQGPYSVISDTLPSPRWAGHAVTVYRPADAPPGPKPVWFFAHGFGGTQAEFYAELQRHLASHGAVVVFSPYPANLRVEDNYDIMFAGFAAAVSAYAGEIDTTRIGVIGHSYGGGAVPALALRAVRERGWGSEGLALMMLAPWYSHGVSDADLAALPAQTRLVVQVYEDDTINDHRMAVDIFEHVTLPATAKAYLTVRSDRVDGYNYEAGHNVPTGLAVPRDEAAYDALDVWGVARIAQALGDATWTGDAAAQSAVFGDGGDGLIPMGVAPGGRALREMVRSAHPEALFPSSRYWQPWDRALNPRNGERFPRLRSRLTNLSVRAQTGEGDAALVVGAIVDGTGPKSLLVRGVGPGLIPYGVTGVVDDPVLTTYRGAAEDLTINDWAQAPSQDALALSTDHVGAFALTEGSADAALQASFLPGAWTVVGRANGGAAGVMLIELYDVEVSSASRLKNLSARGPVGSGESTLVVGLTARGDEPMELLIRGIGPALAGYGVADAVANPRLDVYRDGVVIAGNDDWSGAEVASAAAQVGAFPLATGSADAALRVTLAAGSYTVHLTPAEGSAPGTGLIEVYLVN